MKNKKDRLKKYKELKVIKTVEDENGTTSYMENGTTYWLGKPVYIGEIINLWCKNCGHNQWCRVFYCTVCGHDKFTELDEMIENNRQVGETFEEAKARLSEISRRFREEMEKEWEERKNERD